MSFSSEAASAAKCARRQALPELQRLELLQNQHPHIYLHYLQHLEHLQNQYTHHFYLHQLGYWLESQY